ncbi:MAG: SMC-Scp complex subunit ScpB [Lachnospiraceae bacterium]|nr:SMC-Scp complex subunit ScpB [Lachnospiraceae bacterium]
MENLKASLEAILFASGEAVEAKRIAQALDIDEKLVKNTLTELADEYKQTQRGINIVQLEDSFQMCSAPECYESLIKLCHVPKKHNLTDVMLETLSIIAYKQPVTRQDIESIRGVKSDFAVNKLLEYNLIQELGRKDVPGRPILFGTTEDFLRVFGVSDTDELPVISPEKIEEFTKEAMDETNVVELNNL